MASIEYLEKRVAGKEKEIAKLEKKMERILKAQATGWVDNPYYYHESDIRYTNRDLEQARQALDKYKGQLAQEQEKANSRNVQVVLDFLNDWKEKCFRFYMVAIDEHSEAHKTLISLRDEHDNTLYGTDEYKTTEKAFEDFYKEYRQNCHGIFEPIEGDKWHRERKVADGKWEYARDYLTSNPDDGISKLKKDLEQEANRKYDDIINRTNDIVGEITDASFLRCNEKGNLDGYVIGTRGKAKVETIGAGGYNIQCFHFRTLIHEMK